MKRYVIRPAAANDELKKYPPLMRTLLSARGIRNSDEAERFLRPDWERDVADPFEIHDMRRAVERIFEAFDRKEHIVIYGDYDCDGIPGSVILHDLFKKIQYPHFRNYIPHRHEEGYGINKDAVAQFVRDGVKLMITVDVGIADHESIAYAQSAGLDVIVTDHHEPTVTEGEERLPPAYAVVNSKRNACTYHDDMLCGAGVAFKLAQAILAHGRKHGMFSSIPEGWEKWLLDMAGLSTIADMVPLVRENRALAHYGLRVMRKSRRKGFNALLRACKLSRENLTETDIGYMLAPRINAASRLDHPLRAFELLATDDDVAAAQLAEHLQRINEKRKGHVAAMMKDARKQLAHRELAEVIVVGHADWLPGVLGLAAGKLAEEYARPVFVWGFDGAGVVKGSCRAPEGMSVLEIMRAAPEGTFIQFGGHEASGGFTVSQKQLLTLEEVLSEAARSCGSAEPAPEHIDAVLGLDDVTWDTYRQLEPFAPYGIGNPVPRFLFPEVAIAKLRTFGKGGEHIGIQFRNSRGGAVDAIGFFMSADSFPEVQLADGRQIDLVAEMEASHFRGRPELRLRIVDILPAGTFSCADDLTRGAGK